MKKILLVLIAIIGFGVAANAQSTIYLLYDVHFWEQEIPIKINGQDAFSLIGDTEEIQKVYGKPLFDAPVYSRSKKKCTLYQEGKVILSFDVSIRVAERPGQPPLNRVVPYSDEIQLNLYPNSVHYIKIKPILQGNKIIFEELDEKVGKKEFANKKYAHNPDYIEKIQ